MVRAYVLLMERGRTGEVYNAGSGAAQCMQTVLDRLLKLARLRVEVRQRGDPRRGAAPTVLRAGVRKICQETGWAPARGLDETLADVLDYWRGRTPAPSLTELS